MGIALRIRRKRLIMGCCALRRQAARYQPFISANTTVRKGRTRDGRTTQVEFPFRVDFCLVEKQPFAWYLSSFTTRIICSPIL